MHEALIQRATSAAKQRASPVRGVRQPPPTNQEKSTARTKDRNAGESLSSVSTDDEAVLSQMNINDEGATRVASLSDDESSSEVEEEEEEKEEQKEKEKKEEQKEKEEKEEEKEEA